MSDQTGPREVFSMALRQLYEAADKPDLSSLVSQGAKQMPPVHLKDATLSEWLTGKSIPSEAKRAELRFLVDYLEGRAGVRNKAHVRRAWGVVG